MAATWIHQVRNALRRGGVELVRNDPQSNLLALHLNRLLPRYGVNCVIDVGAREGEYGQLLRRNGYRGRIVSFEPVAKNIEALRNRAGSDPEWVVHPYALGSETTTAEIQVAELTHFSSFHSRSKLSEETFGTESQVVATEQVQIRRLDEVFADVTSDLASPRVYLKMDTQGWDLEVLRGAGEALRQVVALQSEMSVKAFYEGSPSYQEAVQEITGLGYELSGFFPVHVDDDLRLYEFDCVAIRRGTT